MAHCEYYSVINFVDNMGCVHFYRVFLTRRNGGGVLPPKAENLLITPHLEKSLQ